MLYSKWNSLCPLVKGNSGQKEDHHEEAGAAPVVADDRRPDSEEGRDCRDADARGNILEKQGPGKWRVSGATSIEDFRREYPDLGEILDVDTAHL